MTTLAYKEGVIAVDSQATAGNLIVDDDYDKRVVTDHGDFYFCGTPCDVDSFVTEYLTGNKQGSFNWECYAFYVDLNNDLYIITQDSDALFYADRCNPNKHYSLGSGSSFALAAMDMGASAKEAVKMAKKRDTGTGGKIRTYKLGGAE